MIATRAAGRLKLSLEHRPIWIAVAVSAMFTLASLLATNPYQYGVGDNSITLPFVHVYVNPALYPGDYMVAQRIYYYTYLWKVLAWIHSQLGTSTQLLFLATYVAGLFATLLAVYLLAIRLFRSERVAVLSLVFLLFQRPTLAGIDTVENILNTRQLATPLVLFALLLCLERRTVWAFVLLGIAYLIHPLTVHPALVMVVVASVVARRPAASLAAGVGAFGLLAAPVLAWKFAHTPQSLQLMAADPRWVEALHLRSPHHMFPSTWGLGMAIHTTLVLSLLPFAWRWWSPREGDDGRVLVAWVATVIVLCLGGVFFAEVVPIGAAFLFQPLRSFQFLEFLAILGVANLVVAVCSKAKHPLGVAPAIIAGWALVYGVPNVARVAGVFQALTVVLAWERLGRLRLNDRQFALAACVLVVVTGAWLAERAWSRGDFGNFSASNAQDARWLAVQRWARDHTDVRDAFIVPPAGYDEFRVESQRAVYADWEDGGLMNSNPAYGLEWLRRMRILGFTGDVDSDSSFRPMNPEQVRRIAAEMELPGRTVFLVGPLEQRGLGFPVRYQNAAYVVAQVAPPRDVGSRDR